MPVMSGLSGNEMYCLRLKGLAPGEMVIGNSVYSLGFLGSLGAGLRNIAGGEVTQVTQVIHEGRLEAYSRMVAEAEEHGGHGITGVSSDLKSFHGNVEFLSIGTCVHHVDSAARDSRLLNQQRRAGAVLPTRRRLPADQVRLRQCGLFDRAGRRHRRAL